MSDWIEHDGTCCPVPVGTWCERKYADGRLETAAVSPGYHGPEPDEFGIYSEWVWNFKGARHPKWARIIAYRLPRSRAADELIERIRNLDPEREPA